MFIKKSEYEDLLTKMHNSASKICILTSDKCKLESMNKIAEDRIKGLNDKIRGLELEITNLNGLIKLLEERRTELEIKNNILLEDVNKLSGILLKQFDISTAKEGGPVEEAIH